MTNSNIQEGAQEPKEEQEKSIQTPLVITAHKIAEQVYSPAFGQTWFISRRFDSGEIEREAEIREEYRDVFSGEMKERVYRPLDNETLRKRLVFLPDGYEPSTFEEAYREGMDLALEIYDCEPNKVDEVKFLVGIAQSSWFLDRYFPDPRFRLPGTGAFAPIIALRGMPGSGKGRLMNALRFNSYRPFFDVSTTRAPSLYRPLDQWKGTLCLDEADFRYSTETAEIMKYLNCRAYGVPYSRQNPDRTKFNDVFDNFGLTVLTQRRPWEENATEDRTLPYYCEKSQKEISTEELDEWIQRGVDLANKLLYLRLMFWGKVIIDKSLRIKGVKDHRLTAAVLPLFAISEIEPSFKGNISAVLESMIRSRRQVKAMSRDGIILNHLWTYVQDGLIGEVDGWHYIGKEKRKDEKTGEDGLIVPLTTSEIAEVLKWTSKEVRSVIYSLQLVREGESGPLNQKVGGTKYRPIWITPERLAGRLNDYVIEYDSTALSKFVPVVPGREEEGKG